MKAGVAAAAGTSKLVYHIDGCFLLFWVQISQMKSFIKPLKLATINITVTLTDICSLKCSLCFCVFYVIKCNTKTTKSSIKTKFPTSVNYSLQ